MWKVKIWMKKKNHCVIAAVVFRIRTLKANLTVLAVCAS